MPTGYTADVQNGKITELREFALLCARSRGACVTLRDEKLSSDIPEFQVSEYYQNEVTKRQKELNDFLSMSEDEQRELCQKTEQSRIDSANDGLKERKEQRKRYTTMIGKVHEWNPPTSEHVELKKFMIKQLEESIDHDCNTDYYERQLAESRSVPFELWRDSHLNNLKDSLAYSEKSLEEEQNRVDSRNKWVNELKNSLGEPLDN